MTNEAPAPYNWRNIAFTQLIGLGQDSECNGLVTKEGRRLTPEMTPLRIGLRSG
jgi:hypothetical protein